MGKPAIAQKLGWVRRCRAGRDDTQVFKIAGSTVLDILRNPSQVNAEAFIIFKVEDFSFFT